MSCCLRMERIESVSIPASLSVSDCAVERGLPGAVGELRARTAREVHSLEEEWKKLGKTLVLLGPLGSLLP